MKLFAGKNVLIAGGAALLVSGILVFALWNQGPEYQTLYSNLPAEDSSMVIARLKEKRVPYRVDGGAISVPAEKVYELRMELAGEGLPQGGGVGFEIFDKTSFGVTEFVQKVNYRRALQGELARTISQIKEIDSARVHLALPDKGVFLDDQKRARASVVVKLKPGRTLSEGQVSAVVHLVSSSFENLRPEDVTVVDTSGRLWTKTAGEDGHLNLTAGQLEYKRTLEKDLESRVESMIGKVVGEGKVVVRVSADLDTKRIERTEEKFDPDGQVVRSEQRGKESSVGGVSGAGVPGVASNMPGGQAPQAGEVQQRSQRQDEVINYEISKITSRVVEPVGNIKRLTVAVLVDGTYEAVKGTDGKVEKKYAPRTEKDLAQFTEMVKGAVGFTESRGDSVTVVSSPFEDGFTEEAVAEPEREPIVPVALIPTIIKYASLLVVSVLAMLLVVRPLMKKLLDAGPSYDGIERALAQAHPAGEQALGAGPQAQHQLPPEERIENIKKLARENPQQVAMVIRGWLKDK